MYKHGHSYIYAKKCIKSLECQSKVNFIEGHEGVKWKIRFAGMVRGWEIGFIHWDYMGFAGSKTIQNGNGI